MIDFTISTPVIKKYFTLSKGDVIKTSTGVFAFDRFPKGAKNWYGKSMIDSKSYRIRLIDFNQEFNVIGHYNFAPEIQKVIKPSQNDINVLAPGDLFVIKHGRGENAELFRYVRKTDAKIIAINPITNKTFNIDRGFTFTKIDNLPY